MVGHQVAFCRLECVFWCRALERRRLGLSKMAQVLMALVPYART